ncbi:MAG: hypothetical protein IPJ98_00370 [Bryobacterales bacterium]|nr:hypothetical protein [Bryobacterales bacterium]
MRNVEFGLRGVLDAERTRVERAFNILASPELRFCYDSLRRDDQAPPVFPFGGFGAIRVEGRFSDDRSAFFADRILKHRPEMVQRKVSLLLRSCEFEADRMICLDPRRRIEVWIDRSLLPGIAWDATWNQWRHWLRSRIEVDATFVSSGKYVLGNGEWVLRKWLVALPSRTRVVAPDGIGADIERARAIHSLLGEHAVVVERARALVEKAPVEHSTIQSWFDELHVSPQLKPQHVSWRADYEPYYFEQLRRLCQKWLLFRDEYLFLLPRALVSEVPQAGRATYLFTRPDDMTRFMTLHGTVRREDIRRNRDDVASRLGFIGRVVRGHHRKRWLAGVLRYCGEVAHCVEASG